MTPQPAPTPDPATIDDPVLARPIIILGAPRSGTTFLSHSLAGHRDLAPLIEPRLTWRFGNDDKSDMLGASDARPEVIAHIRTRFAEQVRQAGRRRMLEKTPSNALRPAFVDRVFPDALFVHTIRHPVDCVLSIRSFWDRFSNGRAGIAPGRLGERMKEINLRRLPHYGKEVVRRLLPAWATPYVGRNVWGPRLPGIDGMLKELSVLDVCALQWRACVEATCRYGRTLPADRYMAFRLEDISPQTLGRITRFCGLDDDPEVQSRFMERFKPGKPSARRRDTDPQTVERILYWTEPTLKWLGCYPDQITVDQIVGSGA